MRTIDVLVSIGQPLDLTTTATAQLTCQKSSSNSVLASRMCGFDLEKTSEKLVAPGVSQHQDFKWTTSTSSKLSQPMPIQYQFLLLCISNVLVPRLSVACARPPQLTSKAWNQVLSKVHCRSWCVCMHHGRQVGLQNLNLKSCKLLPWRVCTFLC